VVPNAVPVIARNLTPIAPASKIELEKAAAKEAIWTDDFPDWAREAMAAKGKKGWYDMWVTAGVAKRVGERQAQRDDAIERQYHEQVKNQTRLTQALARVSPVASYISCATHLAGTGIEDYHGFVADVDRFFRLCTDARIKMDEELGRKHPGVDPGEYGYDPAAWPVFQSAPVSLRSAVGACWVDLALLLGATVLLLLAAYTAFLRCDVRTS
jgi:hypothetical protein